MAIAVALHCLAALLWVGGMFFAYVVLRPTAAQLDAPIRLQLWHGVFQRFFPWVWLSIATLLLTGLWMVIEVFGGMAQVGKYIHMMIGIGSLMILLFFHLYFAPYKKLGLYVKSSSWQEAGIQLNRIRRIVGINLLFGLCVVFIATYGRYI
jgi:uncharacterized membrane protein